MDEMKLCKSMLVSFAVMAVLSSCNGTANQQPDLTITCNGNVCSSNNSSPPSGGPVVTTTNPPAPQGPLNATDATNAHFLDCQGSVYELYADFSQVDLTQMSIDTSLVTYGIRAAGSAVDFSYYDSESESSAELIPGYPSFSYDGVDNAGAEMKVQVQGTGFVNASASMSLIVNNQAINDTANCQWLQNDIYPAVFGN